MPTLREIQQQIQGFLAEPEADLPMDVLGRFFVYKDAYAIRLKESLTDDFSKTAEFLGADAFEQLLSKFIRLLPSQFSSLAELSAVFPAFLRTHAQEKAAEIADEEWAHILAWSAPEMATMDFSALAALDEESLLSVQFILDPSVTILTTPTFRLIYRYNDETFCLPLDDRESRFLEALTTGQLHQLSEDQTWTFETISKWTAKTIIRGFHINTETIQ